MAQTQIVGAIKIKDGLFIGDEYASQDREFIVTNKVSHIVNCAGTQIANKYANQGVKYLSFNWLENDQEVLFDEKGENVSKIFTFMEECFAQGESCLVHSVRGQSRSCCVLAAYFMKKYSWTLYKTLEYLNSRRPDLEIRASFFYQLNALEARLAKQCPKRTASWNELTNEDTEQTPGQEELIIRNTFLNSHNGPVDEIYTNMQAKLTMLNRNTSNRLVWRDQLSTNKENIPLATIVYNGSPDYLPVTEINYSKLSTSPILKSNQEVKKKAPKPPQVMVSIQKTSQQSISTQSNSQVRSVSSKSQVDSQDNSQNNQLNQLLQANPSFNNLLLNCSLKNKPQEPKKQSPSPHPPMVNNFTKPPTPAPAQAPVPDNTVRSNSLQQFEEKQQNSQTRTNSLKSKQQENTLTNFQEFKNQVQQSLNYFNKQFEAIQKEDIVKQSQSIKSQITGQQSSKLEQLMSPTVTSLNQAKHSEIQKTLSQSISQLQSSYQKFQQLQMKNQQVKQSHSSSSIPKDLITQQSVEISVNKTMDQFRNGSVKKHEETENKRPTSAENKKDSLSPFQKEVKPLKLHQGPPLPQSSSQLYLRNVQCRRQAASTLRNQQKANNSFQEKQLNHSANQQQNNNSFNNNSNSQIEPDSKTQLLKQFAQQAMNDQHFKKLVSPQTKSQAAFTKNQPVKVLQELTDKTSSQKQVKQKDNLNSMSFTLVQKPNSATRTFSPAVKVDHTKAKPINTTTNIRHKIRNSSPAMPKEQDSSSSIQNASAIYPSTKQNNWKLI